MSARHVGKGQRVTASGVRFIKLGREGKWEGECIVGLSPCIRLGFRSKQHEECLAGDWEAVFHYWSGEGGKTKGKATEFTNQVKAFYTADERTLWITFYQRKLYWCFAAREVEELDDGTRRRRTLGSWSCRDLDGKELHYDRLSGALTKVQGFRGTICSVEGADYLLKRLNCELLPEVARADACLRKLEDALPALIRKLGWKDFELLCDLIFTQAGWQRLSAVGTTQKTIDLELRSPVSGNLAAVQVKSKADLKIFRDYEARFGELTHYAEIYFAVHTPGKDLAAHEPDSRVVLLTADRLAKLVVAAGLAGWLIQKTS